MNRPLVTFAILAYHHERFIREAVRGALSQTYSPLQIIVSDDCSDDGTFEAAQKEVEGYDGPHEVVLNRNERNLGYMGHMNRIMELADGELVVPADGDDVSLPTRTEELVRAWSEEDVTCVYSNYILVDEDGVEERVEVWEARMQYGQEPPKSWEEMVRSGRTGITGCSLAWDRAAFDVFGPLPDRFMTEDVPIPFRAALLGRVAYVDKPLVLYRRHDTNTSALIFLGFRGESLSQFTKREGTTARMFGNHYESWLRDMDLFSSPDAGSRNGYSEAMRITSARVDFYRFKEASSKLGIKDRLSRLPRAVRSVRVLGLNAVMKLCLLSASPTAYYWVQRSSKKPPSVLLTEPSEDVDPSRVLGPR